MPFLLQVLGQEPRQTTSNLGHLQKPSVQALIHGLNRHYYSISINYRKNELEQKMLLNLHKKTWMDGLTLAEYSEHSRLNENIVSEMLELAKNYNKVKYVISIFAIFVYSVRRILRFSSIFAS